MDLSVKRIKLEPQTHLIKVKPTATLQANFNHRHNQRSIKMENHNSDSNDSSDSERLQVDISMHDDDGSLAQRVAAPCRQQQIFVGRETPDSMASDDQQEHDGTDPATTQLWQALAHTRGSYFYALFLLSFITTLLYSTVTLLLTKAFKFVVICFNATLLNNLFPFFS